MTLLSNTMRSIFLVIGSLILFCNSLAQVNSSTLAEQLGYPADAKLLIIHADDLGVGHSENSASISAWEKHGINSASVMVPTPWFPEIAHYSTKNPEFDLGLHLTVTSEWDFYKWNGVLTSSEIPSLVTEKDYFYASVSEVVQNADPQEIKEELRAQVERAIDFGMNPTHLDSHMGALFADPDFFEAYLNIGKEYEIPVFVPVNWIEDEPKAVQQEIFALAEDYPVRVQQVVIAGPQTPESDWFKAYDEAIKNLEPGLNEFIIHTAYDDAEMQAMTINNYHLFEASWRQRDYDYVVSQRFKDLLNEENIQLVTWREIQNLMYSDNR